MANTLDPDDRTQNSRQLLVDVSTLAQRDAGTGIQRVVRATLASLCEATPADYKIRLVSASRRHSYRYVPDGWLGSRRPDARLNLTECPAVEVNEGDIFLGLDLAASIVTSQRRLFTEWRRIGVSICFVVYDLLPYNRPRWFTFRLRWRFKRWLSFIAAYADRIIAISAVVAADFQAWRLERSRDCTSASVHVVPLAGDIASSFPTRGLPPDAADLLSWIRQLPTVMMLGTIEPRKGHKAVLAAFNYLWKKAPDCGVQLLVVGKGGWKTAQVQKSMRERSNIGGKFLWLESVSDEFLEILYRDSAGVLIASEGEGAGLPILEASAYNRWVLARDIPVFREHGLSSVLYFSDDSPKGLGTAVMRLVEASASPPPVIEQRSWKDFANDLLHSIGVNGAVEQ